MGERWLALAPRERRLVAAALLVVLAGLAYAWLLEPAWRDRSRILAELPRLQAELAELESMRAAVLARRGGSAGAGPAATRPALEASLARQGLAARVDADPRGGTTLALRGVPAPALLSWLASAEAEGLDLQRVRLTRSGEPGLVDAEVVVRAKEGSR